MNNAFTIPALILALAWAGAAPVLASEAESAVQGLAERLGSLLEQAGIPNPYAPLTQITHNRMVVPEWAKYLRLDVKVEAESGDDVLQVIFRKAPFVQGDSGVTRFFAVKEATAGWMTHYVKIPDGFAGEVATLTLRLCSTDPAEQTDPEDSCSGADGRVLVDDVFFATLVPFDDDPPGDADGNGDEDDKDGVVFFFDREDSPVASPRISPVRVPGAAKGAPDTPIASVVPPIPASNTAPPPGPTLGNEHVITYWNQSNRPIEVRFRVRANDFLVYYIGNDAYPFNNHQEAVIELNPANDNYVIIPAGLQVSLLFRSELPDDYWEQTDQAGQFIHANEEIPVLAAMVVAEGREIGDQNPRPSLTTTYNMIYLVDAADDDFGDGILKFSDTLQGTQRALTVVKPKGLQLQVTTTGGAPNRFANEPVNELEEKLRLDANQAATPAGTPVEGTLKLRFNGSLLKEGTIQLRGKATPTQTVNLNLQDFRDKLTAFRAVLEKPDPAYPKSSYEGFDKALPNPITDEAFETFATELLRTLGRIYGARPDLLFDFEDDQGLNGVVLFNPFPRTPPSGGAGGVGLSLLDFGFTTFREYLQDGVDGRSFESLSPASKRFLLDRLINQVRDGGPDPADPSVHTPAFINFAGIFLVLDVRLKGMGKWPEQWENFHRDWYLRVAAQEFAVTIAHELGHNFGLFDQYRYDACDIDSLPLPAAERSEIRKLINPPERAFMGDGFLLPDSQSASQLQLDALRLAFDDPRQTVPSGERLNRLLQWYRLLDIFDLCNRPKRPEVRLLDEAVTP